MWRNQNEAISDRMCMYICAYEQSRAVRACVKESKRVYSIHLHCFLINARLVVRPFVRYAFNALRTHFVRSSLARTLSLCECWCMCETATAVAADVLLLLLLCIFDSLSLLSALAVHSADRLIYARVTMSVCEETKNDMWMLFGLTCAFKYIAYLWAIYIYFIISIQLISKF